jgi:hypothetical protein
MKNSTRTTARRKAVVALALTLGAVGVTHGVASASAPASIKLGSIKLGVVHQDSIKLGSIKLGSIHHEDSIKLGSIKLGRTHGAQPGSIKLG